MTFVQVFMLYWYQKLPWKEIGLLIALLVFEVAMHPLGIGPDRRIHDPAVYRLADENYLPNDWYTDMAVESGVYTFYAALIQLGPNIGIGEELWRQIIYILCLGVLYYALIKITGLFTKSLWVTPLIVLFHAFLMLYAPPSWLYGPFIHIDGGLAPRSVGVALSFLALLYLLKGARSLPWILLGLATLIHVSNSLIVFLLFLGSLIGKTWWEMAGKRNTAFWRGIWWQGVRAVVLYLMTGGWFVVWVALQGNMEGVAFSTEKFIWAWVYLRAPYMALPFASWKMWTLFSLHIGALLGTWYWLRARLDGEGKNRLDSLGLIGMGGVGLFFLFYLFTFIVPWLPGFQFYSLRVVYLTHFVAYLFLALAIVLWWKRIEQKNLKRGLVVFLIGAIIIFFGFIGEGKHLLQRGGLNLQYTWVRTQDLRNPVAPPSSDQAVARYLFLHREPFLAPPRWLPSPMYLPHVVSLKTFGFTPKGLEEWYGRLNAVSQGELEQIWEKQSASGRFRPVKVDWEKVYHRLSPQTVRELSERYSFHFFVASKKKIYPFPVLAEDAEYRLYEVAP